MTDSQAWNKAQIEYGAVCVRSTDGLRIEEFDTGKTLGIGNTWEAAFRDIKNRERLKLKYGKVKK